MQQIQVGATDIAFERIGKSLEWVFAIHYGVEVLDTDLQVTTEGSWPNNLEKKEHLFPCALLSSYSSNYGKVPEKVWY